MKVLLFGYGEMGSAALEHLLAAKDEVVGVVTHRDDPHEKRWYRSLADMAANVKLDVIYGDDLGPKGLAELARKLAPDVVLSSYYRKMISTKVLAAARRAALNLHGSMLPRLRGRAPANWALVEGEEKIGITLHHMVKEPDAGDIVAQRGWDIGPRDTALTIFRRTVGETKLLLKEIWPKIVDGTAPRTPQDHSKATYRGRRTPDDGKIDWSKPAKRIDGLVRAVTIPFPGAFTFLGGRKLMVWEGSPAAGQGRPGEAIGPSLVATGEGAYRLERVEWADEPAKAPSIPTGTRLEG